MRRQRQPQPTVCCLGNPEGKTTDLVPFVWWGQDQEYDDQTPDYHRASRVQLHINTLMVAVVWDMYYSYTTAHALRTNRPIMHGDETNDGQHTAPEREGQDRRADTG